MQLYFSNIPLGPGHGWHNKIAYEDYQQEVVEKWQKSPDNQNNALEERIPEKIERLQGLEKDIQYYGIQIKDRESR